MEELRELLLGSPILIVAVLLAVGVVLSLRAVQVWRQRRLFGLDPYAASRRRDWLRGWARVVLVVAALAGGLLLIASVVPLPFSEALRAAISGPASSSAGEGLEGPLNVTPFPTAVPVAGARLIIPRIGVDTPLIEAPIVGRDWDISLLRDEVAHLGGTASVGQPGNIVLAGHITIPGGGWGPFRELEQMTPGDEVFIRYREAIIRYEVVDLQIVGPNDVHVVFPTEEDRLTLITCTDWDDELGAYAARIVVFAVPLPVQ